MLKLSNIFHYFCFWMELGELLTRLWAMISSIQSRKGSLQFKMSVNYLYHLHKNLEDCYRYYELDWALLPESLRKVSILLRPFYLSFLLKQLFSVVCFFRCAAKAFKKQQDTSILFGLIVLTSFWMGHACVNVQNAFWKEPAIIWIASLITTGTLFGLKTN